MTLLAASDLTVGYAERRVLAGVSLAVVPGELICVLGPNGAGKSTLLRTLAGMQPPLAGGVTLCGRPLAELTPRQLARRIGVVLPERARPGLLRVSALVALGRYPYTGWLGRLGPEDVARVGEAIRQVGIEALAERDVGTLSDGERQKAMIARALAQEPTLLILDEPTAFLDLPGRVEVLGLLARLVHDRAGERAALLSTHDLDLALRTADRVWLLDGRGGLVDGAPEDLVLSGAFAAAFAGSAVHFDVESGSFRTTRLSRGTVVLTGAGAAAVWTRRALERRGYEVVAAGAGGAGAVAAVEVSTGGGATSWRSTVDGAVAEHASIGVLLRSLSS